VTAACFVLMEVLNVLQNRLKKIIIAKKLKERKMKEIKAIIRQFKLDNVITELHKIEGLPGITISEIKGFGKGKGKDAEVTVSEGLHQLVPKVKIEIVDEQGKKVSSPPLIDATVAENGIFELKLLLEKHVPFRPGSYEVTASVQNGPSAATEIFMIA